MILLMPSAAQANSDKNKHSPTSGIISGSAVNGQDIAGAVTSADAASLVNDFTQFIPRPDGRTLSLDYSVFDEALSDVIIDLGPSTRIFSRGIDSGAGAQIVTGHKSAFRLEGRRFTFSFINDEYKAGLTAYRKDLEAVAAKYDIAKLSKKEQLAFWYNLHNVAVIEQIAIEYPVRRPSKIKIQTAFGPVNFHDAKFLNIRGQALSLRDIRENIVYANWDDPDVIYGFFHGDIGGPSVQEYAYTAERLDYMLGLNAAKFVNSLRGYRNAFSHDKVSLIYETEGRFFFPNWQEDLKAHLLKHANETVEAALLKNKSFKTSYHTYRVADLAGGAPPSIRLLGIPTFNSFGFENLDIHPDAARLLGELEKKYFILRRRGVVGDIKNGRVEIIDIETEDPDLEDAP